MPLIKLSLSLLFTLFFTCTVQADQLTVTDGDTVRIGEERIRFNGIDAPELKQTCIINGVENFCGLKAKEILIEKISDQKVVCVSEGKDQYKRTLAECFVNDESLSSYLVRSGYAFAYRKYSKKFVSDEEFAKSNKLGIWSMEFDYPWDWRKKN